MKREALSPAVGRDGDHGALPGRGMTKRAEAAEWPRGAPLLALLLTLTLIEKIPFPSLAQPACLPGSVHWSPATQESSDRCVCRPFPWTASSQLAGTVCDSSALQPQVLRSGGGKGVWN